MNAWAPEPRKNPADACIGAMPTKAYAGSFPGSRAQAYFMACSARVVVRCDVACPAMIIGGIRVVAAIVCGAVRGSGGLARLVALVSWSVGVSRAPRWPSEIRWIAFDKFWQMML